MTFSTVGAVSTTSTTHNLYQSNANDAALPPAKLTRLQKSTPEVIRTIRVLRNKIYLKINDAFSRALSSE
jgi:hypothetical protein